MSADVLSASAPLIDAHCHLDFPEISAELELHLRRCAELGVERLVIPGVRPDRWEAIIALAAMHPQIWFCLGIHPWYAHQVVGADWSRLERLCEDHAGRMVAIGECGLDRLRGSLDEQLPVFLRQIALARALNKPLVLHAVRCHAKILELLRCHGTGLKGVVHGFSGSLEEALAYVRQGFWIGVGPRVTQVKAEKLRRVVAALPASALVLETDAPDMAVAGFARGEGRPEHVDLVWGAVSALKGESQLRAILYENAVELYGWMDVHQNGGLAIDR